MSNPFYAEWPSPFGLPSFSDIEPIHFEEAFQAGFDQNNEEIDTIANSLEAPTFANTVVELERAGELLSRVADVFFNLSIADTNDQIQALELKIAPRLAVHEANIYQNTKLFQRVLSVKESGVSLDADQAQLVSDLIKEFVRAGANLDESTCQDVQKLGTRLATLMAEFGQNVLKDSNAFELIVETPSVLAALPQWVRDAALAEGDHRGCSGQHVFTLSRSSITPCLQFINDRALREEIYRAYSRCGNNDDVNDNKKILSEIALLRAQRASKLGFADHAAFMLSDRMAESSDKVRNLLDQIWQPARARAEEEAVALQQVIQNEGGNFTLAPWDWLYYTEKLRKQRFDLDEGQYKPYFALERVRQGAFAVAQKLYGIRFQRLEDVPVYHPDVDCYRVEEADGTFIGLFMTDYFARSSKRSGAWMSHYRAQSHMDERVTPIIVNCCNFQNSHPCLLSMDEVRTLFHEFGHGLHGLLSKVRYPSQSGTNVKQDFVELPSQIMEHWATEPEVMQAYARHVDSDESIPIALVEKLIESEKFNQGFATSEYLAASYLDLAWHELGDDVPQVDDLEAVVAEGIGLNAAIDPRYLSTYFQHIFSGESYSAGYYSYIWAEVLDADGFEVFKENGIFDPQTAEAFRKHILQAGGTADPGILYQRFAGHEPVVEPLLRQRGLA